MKKLKNLIVCASGGGGNFKYLVENASSSSYEIKKLIVSRICPAIQIAVEGNIPAEICSREPQATFDSRFISLIPAEIDLIVLAGFMPILPEEVCKKFQGKIINTHPSLLPKHGGLGMYGVKVQESVIKNGDAKAGCSVHYVTREVDDGEIILRKEINVIPGESAWALGGRVFKEEGPLLLAAINLILREQDK